ncbi:hypothetical protein C3K47_03120 [Solitalea longa]|uniref:Uncharacterized protein n=1 Tax=Solitalea longa TaxID=2079460 RepID=A0A2S5A780_9SPHI|nr:hypothetical protein [Solitalea longa]POY38405.1 hypothetical protein C3K47_03120 [Solitalea longa]
MKSKLIATVILFFTVTSCQKSQTLTGELDVEPTKAANQKSVEALPIVCTQIPTELKYGDATFAFEYATGSSTLTKVTISKAGTIKRVISLQYNRSLKPIRINVTDGAGVLSHYYKFTYSTVIPALSKTELYKGNGTLIGNLLTTYNANGTINKYDPPADCGQYDSDDYLRFTYKAANNFNLEQMWEVTDPYMDNQAYFFESYDTKSGIFKHVKYIDWLCNNINERAVDGPFFIFNNQNNVLSQDFWFNDNIMYESSYSFTYDNCGYPVSGVASVQFHNTTYPENDPPAEIRNISVKYKSL